MDKAYHPANLNLQSYPHDAVIELAEHGARLGILFHIEGIPFGADFDKSSSVDIDDEDRRAFERAGGLR